MAGGGGVYKENTTPDVGTVRGRVVSPAVCSTRRLGREDATGNAHPTAITSAAPGGRPVASRDRVHLESRRRSHPGVPSCRYGAPSCYRFSRSFRAAGLATGCRATRRPAERGNRSTKLDFQLQKKGHARRLIQLRRIQTTDEMFEKQKQVTWTGEHWDAESARPAVNAPRGCPRDLLPQRRSLSQPHAAWRRSGDRDLHGSFHQLHCSLEVPLGGEGMGQR